MLCPVNGESQSFCRKVPLASALNETADGPILRPSGLAEEVYRRIRADIMSLKIPPDSRVSVDNLARELGTARVGFTRA